MSGLWPLVWRAIGARPLRSSLTVAAVALGIAVLLGVQITINGLDAQAAAAQQLSAGASGLDVRVDAGLGLTPDEVQRVAGLAGVAQAVPLYEKQVAAAPAGSGLQGMNVSLVGLQDGTAALRPVELVSGRLPHPGSASEVAIDAGLATALAKKPGTSIALGQRVQLITTTGPDMFTVVGLTTGTSAGPAFTRSAVFADAAVLHSEFSLGLRTPLVALRLGPGATPASVAAEVHDRLGATVTTYDPNSGGLEPLADLRPLLALVTLLSVVVGAGVTANSVALAVIERRRDIGLLRAAGASAAQVFRVFAAEGLVIATCAVPLGVGAGIALGAGLAAHYTPSDLPGAAVGVGAGEVLTAVVAGLGAAVIGGVIPALIAARLPVLSALRPHPDPQRRRVPPGVVAGAAAALAAAALCFASASSGFVALGVALFLVGIALTLCAAVPVFARATARGLARVSPGASSAAAAMVRSRNRSALTAAGLAVSVATAVAVSALTAGALSASDGWISRLFVGDMVITSPVTQRDAVAGAVQESLRQDVSAVTALRFFSAPIGGEVLGITALDPAVYASDGGLDIVSGDAATAFGGLEDGPAFIAPEQLAAAAGWHAGTQLPVVTAKGIVYFTVTGIASHSFPGGDGNETMVMADDIARTYFGSPVDGFDDLVLRTDGAASTVQDVAETYGMRGVSVSDISAAARDSLQHSIGLLLALAVVSVTIAMLAVVNTLMVNVRQRTRELALLRAVGMGRRQAIRLVLGEALLLTLAAVLIGVGTGCVIALPMLRASSAAGFTPTFVFPAVTAIVLGGVIVVSAVAVTLGPARRAASASVLDALRHE